MIRFRDVFKDKNFLLLWLAQVISNFGDRLNQMALVALVYQRNPGSAIALAKLIALTVIPVFIIGPIAGAWVDRLNRRNVMIICDILRGILVLSIPLLIAARQMLIVYFVVFITFTISRFFIPSKMAIIPELVTKEKLLMANALSDTTHMIGNVIGLVVAGIIVNMPRVGAIGGFYIDAATFFISALLITMIVQRQFVRQVRSDLELTKEAFKHSIRRSIFGEIKEGLKYLAHFDEMHFVVYIFFIIMSAIGAVSCVVIVFIQEAFGNATRDLGFLGVFLVAGLFAGSLLYGRFGQNIDKRKAIHASLVAMGTAIILFTAFVKCCPNLLLVGTVSLFIGMAASPVTASITTLTHEMIPDGARGRIFSSLEAVIHLGFLISMLVAAYAAKFMESSSILIFTGTMVASCGILGSVVGKNNSRTT